MADVAELADALVSETSAQGRVGSTPSVRIPQSRRTGNAKALARRLSADLLRDEDKRLVETVTRIRALHKKGASSLEISRALGRQERDVRRLTAGKSFEVVSEHLERLESGNDAKLVDRIVRQAKQDFAQFAPDAIRYIRECFTRTPDNAAWKDDAKAQWATQLVAKGLGLTEPDTAIRPQINIHGNYIHVETAQVEEDDEEARIAAATDITPLPPSEGAVRAREYRARITGKVDLPSVGARERARAARAEGLGHA